MPTDLRPYLTEIAERLYSGHATVMFGSGFSRNATRTSLSQSVFPDWSQLGDLFYRKLYDSPPDADSSYLAIPTLAHEVEVSIGRPALDQLLRSFIPDQEYEPSKLHIEMLKLPWADVFTTNYDTLLERACESVTSRKYDIVVTQEDLIYSEAPRIIKLHGSFPSVRPFIVTDEDYRSYPDSHAPLVNTVRQTLLENTLCLIGFSGNDPNFLQWVGWIQDNLGRQYSPKMYLIGMLDLSESQIKLFERRNIVPLDLSKFSGIKQGDHFKAYECFIEFLHLKRSAFNQLDWPPKMPQSVYRRTSEVVNAEQISLLVSRWKADRISYPGWVIVPGDRYSFLWSTTREWVDYCPSPNSLSEDLELKFAFELVWRTEKSLCPISDNQIHFLETILDRYLPPGMEKVLEPTSMEQGSRTESGLDRNGTRDMCHFLILALMRYYREEGLSVKWNSVCRKAQDCLSEMSPEHEARFNYERILFSLFALNQPEFKKRVSEWQIDDSLPFWAARRAALLAESGQLEDAGKILSNSLAEIRKKSNLRSITTDYSRVSQESFVMFLLYYLHIPLSLARQEPFQFLEADEGFTQRRHTLRQFKCDPWNELMGLTTVLEQTPGKRSNVTEQSTFDIGGKVRMHHLVMGNPEALAAFRYLRFCEDAGIPFGSMVSTRITEGTLSRIGELSPYWAMASLVRTGNTKAVDSLFNRVSLTGMTLVSIDSMIDRYLEAIEIAVTEIEANRRFSGEHFGSRLAKVVPEILSRLCCKCSDDARNRVFNFLVRVYRSVAKGSYAGIGNLTERLLASYAIHRRCELVPRLLEFPILSNLHDLEKREFVNPFLHLNLKRDWISIRPAISTQRFDMWVKAVISDDASIRSWSSIALFSLHNWGFLDSGQTNQFVEALWSRTDEDGFPFDTGLPPSCFLSLPNPTEVDQKALFKKYALQTQFPIQGNSKRSSITLKPDPLCFSIRRASLYLAWTNDELQSIMKRLIAWWDIDKNHLHSTSLTGRLFGFADQIKQRLIELVDTLVSLVTLLHIPTDDSEIRESLDRLIRELSQYGMPTLNLESASLRIFPERRQDVIQKIRSGMAASSKEIVKDSLDAIRIMLDSVGEDTTESEKEELRSVLRLVSQVLLWRRVIRLPEIIVTIEIVVKRHQWAFTEDLESTVLEGLRHLISDTTVREQGDPRAETDENGLDVPTKLVVRKEAACLAYTLSLHYEHSNNIVPNVLKEWESICQSDEEFAEIRAQWIA